VAVRLLPDDIQQQLPIILEPSVRTRRFAGLAIFLVLVGAALLGLLHAVSKHMSPLSEPLSN
jgi:hypothetical protein